MKPASDIAERLLDLKEATGYTHAQIGDLAGRLVGSVSEWTLGKRVPSGSALERLAAKLDLPISVFEDGGPMPSALLRAAQARSLGGEQASGVAEPPPPPYEASGIPTGKRANGDVTPGPDAQGRVTDDLDGRSVDDLIVLLEGARMGGAKPDQLLQLTRALERAIEREGKRRK